MSTPVRRAPMRHLGLAAAVLVAVTIRVVTALEVAEGPVLHLQAWGQTDMHFYDAWARRIAAGDLLTAEGMRPYHIPHDIVARRAHALSGSPEPFDEAVGRRLWGRWLGERAFYQDPLYSYVLAAVYAVVGHQPRAVFLLQAILGVATVVLVHQLARRLFGARVATIAGFGAALFGPFVFYELVLLRTALNTFVGLATLCLFVEALRAHRPAGWCFAAGVAAGVAGLLQSNALLFAACMVAIAAVSARRDRRRLVTSVAGLLGGLGLALSPLVARNLAVGVSPFALASSGAMTFANHNAADYAPEGGDYYSGHLHEILLRTDGRFVPAAVATLQTHPTPWSYLALLGRKLLVFWHWYELPNNANYYYFLLCAPLVAGSTIPFWLIGPLGGAGLLLTCRRSAAHVAAAAYVGCGVFTSVVFYSLSRFRTPVVAVLIAFAAFTVQALVQGLRAGAWRRVLGLGVGVGALAAVSLRPLGEGRTTIAGPDYRIGNTIVRELAVRRAAGQDLAGAIMLVERQLRTEPEELRRLETTAPPVRVSRPNAEIAASFAELHAFGGKLYEAEGDEARATEHARRARVLGAVAEPAPAP